MVNLSKGQSISLEKPTGAPLARVRMGLGWDPITVTRKGLFGGSRTVQKSVDLDASAALLDAGARVVERVYFGHLRSDDGSVQHTGDNLTGRGEGDDESLDVDLSLVSPAVHHIVFTVNSFSGQGFSEIENASCRLLDLADGDREVARYDLSATGPHRAQVMARVSREGSGWRMTAVGELVASARTVRDLDAAVQAAVR